MKFLVQATDKYINKNIYDGELSIRKGVAQYYPKPGEQWEVDYERKETLVEQGFVTVVKEINEEVIETAKKEVKTEKAVKRVTKKTK